LTPSQHRSNEARITKAAQAACESVATAAAAATAAATAAAAAAAAAAAPLAAPLPPLPSVAQTFHQGLAMSKLQSFLSTGRDFAMRNGNVEMEAQYVEGYQRAVGAELRIAEGGSFDSTATPMMASHTPSFAGPAQSTPLSFVHQQQHVVPQLHASTSSAPAGPPRFDPYTGRPVSAAPPPPSFCMKCGMCKAGDSMARFCSRCGASF